MNDNEKEENLISYRTIDNKFLNKTFIRTSQSRAVAEVFSGLDASYQSPKYIVCYSIRLWRVHDERYWIFRVSPILTTKKKFLTYHMLLGCESI